MGRKKFKVLLVTTPVVILIFLFCAYLLFHSKTSQKLDIGYGIAKSNEVVKLQIGDANFSIPKKYIWSREDWIGGAVQGVNIAAELNTMNPFDASTEKQYKHVPWDNKLLLLIGERVDLSQNTNENFSVAAYKRKLANRKYRIEPKPSSLNQVIFEPKQKTDYNLYFSGAIDSPDYWVQCVNTSTIENAYCESYYDITKNVYVSYTFGGSELHRWSDIRGNVIQFISKIQNK